MEDVEAASKEDVDAFFRRYYVPANASLAIVGDIDEDGAFGLAERYFGPIPGGVRADAAVDECGLRRPSRICDQGTGPGRPRGRRAGQALSRLEVGPPVRPRRRPARPPGRHRRPRAIEPALPEVGAGRGIGPGRHRLSVRPGAGRDFWRGRDPEARQGHRAGASSRRVGAADDPRFGHRGARAGPGPKNGRIAAFHLCSRQHRRLRRRGRSAQRLQHLPRRSGADHRRHRPVPGRHGRGSHECRGPPAQPRASLPQGARPQGADDRPDRPENHAETGRGRAVSIPEGRRTPPSMRVSALGPAEARPADRRRHGRPQRGRRRPWSRSRRPGQLDGLDDGRGDDEPLGPRPRRDRRGDGDLALDQLRLGRLICRAPVPDQPPARELRPGLRPPPQSPRSPNRNGTGSPPSRSPP